MTTNLYQSSALASGFDLNEILGTALTTVASLLDALDAAAVSGVSYKEPWLMLSRLEFALGEKEEVRTRATHEGLHEYVALDWWDETPASDIAACFHGDKDGALFNRLLSLAITLRARDDLGGGDGRLEAFDKALHDFESAARYMAFDWRPDPYALLNSADLDFEAPESREAAEIVNAAEKVVSEFYADLVRAACARTTEYDNAFVLLSFDKVTAGGPPQVGERHLAASDTRRAEVILFPEPISAEGVMRAFQFDESEMRVHLVTALINLRQLHERGSNSLVERDLRGQIASLKTKLWFALNAS